MHDYEGEYGEEEIGGCHVYRVDPQTGDVRKVAGDFEKPNGLAFSPDERLLYVADTGASHLENGPRHIRRFSVSREGALSGGEVFASCTSGLFDGFRVDRMGRVWASAADGVHCHDPDGTLIGKIRIPEIVSNLTFGGVRRNRLFITATSSLYAVYVTANGSTLG
jgi:gluconolactonase